MSDQPAPGSVVRPPMVGVLVDSTEDAFSHDTLLGLADVFTPAGVQMVCLTYGSDRTNWDSAARHKLLDEKLAQQEFDAIIFTGGISHQVEPDQLEAYYKAYLPVPVVSLAVAIPGVPSVVTRGSPGMEGLMAHLLDEHGYRRLVYLGGPVGQDEAEERLAAFRTALARRGLEPVWVEAGDFTTESGYLLAQKALDRGGPTPEVIVCASDNMALGVMRALRERGREPGRDVAVTGFDDVVTARFHDPSLTTVHQSISLMARLAAKLALRQIRGEAVAEVNPLDSWLVVRRSCGCPENRGGALEKVRDLLPEGNLASLGEQLERALHLPDPVFRDVQIHELLGKALALLPDEHSLTVWIDFLEGLVAGESDHEDLKVLLNAALRQAEEQQIRVEVMGRFAAGSATSKLRQLAESILTSFRMDELLKALAQDLPGLGIDSCFLSLYDDADERRGRLIFGFHEGHRLAVSETSTFDPVYLIPEGIRSVRWSSPIVVVESLYSEGAPFGFVVLATSLANSQLTGTLRSHLSGALQCVRQLALTQKSNHELKTALANLERANHHLSQSERLAGLGQLVAGIAHEINSPLGIALLAADHLEQRMKALSEGLEAGSLDRKALQEGFCEAAEATGMVLSNLRRSAHLISGFKQVAADQTSEERRVFLVAAYVEEVLSSLRPQWKHRPLTLTFQGDRTLVMDSYPGLLAQIVTNLLMNAVLHAFPEGRSGALVVEVHAHDADRLVLRFSDDGIGIPADILPSVFDPFFTTRRGEGGTGLGLSIVHNLVHKVLGGSIELESVVGVGSTFTLTLPLTSPGGMG